MICCAAKFNIPSTLLFLVVFLGSSVSLADTRVMVRFDETGHYSHRVVKTESSAVESALDTLKKPENPTPGSAYVRWLDDTGQLLQISPITDPRLTHAPLDGSRDLAWAVIREGAYIVSGPSSATLLEVTLPAKSTPQLLKEVWKIDLSSAF